MAQLPAYQWKGTPHTIHNFIFYFLIMRNIYNVIVDRISLLEGCAPAVERAESKFALIKSRKPKISEKEKEKLLKFANSGKNRE